VLGSVFGPEKAKVAEVWRKLHNEDFIIFTLCNILRMRKVRCVACMGNRINTCEILVRNLKGG